MKWSKQSHVHYIGTKMSNAREVAVDLAKAIRGVFKQNTQRANRSAWKAISSGQGKEEITKYITNPGRSLNSISRLRFSEWLEAEEQTLSEKSL